MKITIYVDYFHTLHQANHFTSTTVFRLLHALPPWAGPSRLSAPMGRYVTSLTRDQGPSHLHRVHGVGYGARLEVGGGAMCRRGRFAYGARGEPVPQPQVGSK